MAEQSPTAHWALAAPVSDSASDGRQATPPSGSAGSGSPFRTRAGKYVRTTRSPRAKPVRLRESWVLLVEEPSGPLCVWDNPPRALCPRCDGVLRTAYDGTYQTTERHRHDRRVEKQRAAEVQYVCCHRHRRRSGSGSPPAPPPRSRSPTSGTSPDGSRINSLAPLIHCSVVSSNGATSPSLAVLDAERAQNRILEEALLDLQGELAREVAEGHRLREELSAARLQTGTLAPAPELASLRAAMEGLSRELEQQRKSEAAATRELREALEAERRVAHTLRAKLEVAAAELAQSTLLGRVVALEKQLAEVLKDREATSGRKGGLHPDPDFQGRRTGKRVSLEDSIDLDVPQGDLWHKKPADHGEGDLVKKSRKGRRVSVLDQVQVAPTVTEDDGGSTATNSPALSFQLSQNISCDRVTTGMGDWICSADFSPDRKHAALGCSDGSVQLRKLTSGRKVGSYLGHEASVTAVAFSADGTLIAAGSAKGLLLVWNVYSKAEVRAFQDTSDSLCAVTFSPDASLVASGDSEGGIWQTAVAAADASVLNSDDGMAREGSFSNPDSISALVYAPSGTILASAGALGTIRLWDTTSLRVIAALTGHTDWVNCLAFAPDGAYLLSGGSHGTLRLWDIAERSERRCFARNHQGLGIEKVAVAPDGQSILTGDTQGGLSWWRIDTEKWIKRFKGHQNAVCALAFLPDSEGVLSLSTAHWGSPDNLIHFALSDEGLPTDPSIYSLDTTVNLNEEDQPVERSDSQATLDYTQSEAPLTDTTTEIVGPILQHLVSTELDDIVHPLGKAAAHDRLSKVPSTTTDDVSAAGGRRVMFADPP